MKLQTKLSRNGNSWYVRLPKELLGASGIKPDDELVIKGAPGRIMVYSPRLTATQEDKFDAAKQDARATWDEAFEQVWLELFGVDE